MEGFERHLGAFAPGLVDEGVDVLLDGGAEFLDALLEFGLGGLVGRVTLGGFGGVADGLAGQLERSGGPFGRAFLEGEGEGPEPGLHLVYGGLAVAAHQEGTGGAEVQEYAHRVVEQVRTVGQRVEGGAGLLAVAGGAAELLADQDDGLGHGVAELALRELERHLGALAALARCVLGDHAAKHGKAGPGMGREVLRDGAVGRLGAAGEGGRDDERGSLGAVLEVDLGLDGGDAVIVVGLPGEAGAERRAAAGGGGARGVSEGHHGRAIGQDCESPAGEGAATADVQLGDACLWEVALGLPTGGIQRAELGRLVVEG